MSEVTNEKLESGIATIELCQESVKDTNKTTSIMLNNLADEMIETM
jgi:hypothetical protein